MFEVVGQVDVRHATFAQMAFDLAAVGEGGTEAGRKWPTERKHLPLKEVAAAGGWEDESVVLSIYQQVDEETMYQVVANPRELRDVK